MDPETQPEQPRAASAVATESTPLLPRSGSDVASPSRSVPRWVIIGHWTTAVGGLLVSALAFAVFVAHEFHSPSMYHLPYGIKGFVPQMILAVRSFLPTPATGWKRRTCPLLIGIHLHIMGVR